MDNKEEKHLEGKHRKILLFEPAIYLAGSVSSNISVCQCSF